VKIDIMTLFPDSMKMVLGESIIGRAAKKGILDINCVQIRDFTENKQCQVDDYPYGGGWGCVMMAQPLKSCLDDIMSRADGLKSRVIYMSPQGKTFTQADARRLRDDYNHLVLVCGHYEGIDERFIEECVDEELSIGDFVVTGGEIPAMAITDSVCRLIPGVLADEECFTGESHWDGLLEYPQYTRPEVWEGRSVPSELLSGNHANVDRWRRKKSIERTMDKRPDMFHRLEITDVDDKKLLNEILDERSEKPVEYKFDCRRAEQSDIKAIMEIIADAKRFLTLCGVDQWQDGYPTENDYIKDIAAGDCWVADCGGRTVGVASVCMEPEPCYRDLTDGQWLTEGENYAVIHRSAIRADMRGTALATELFEFIEALSIGKGRISVRVDTHHNNKSMRGLLSKLGYSVCGNVIYDVGEGHDPVRIALEKVM